MNKKIHFFDEVYKTNVLFLVGNPSNFSEESQRFGLDFPEDSDGRTFLDYDYGIIIWLRDFKKTPYWLDVLTHEIIHGAIFTLDYHGWRIDAHNEEPLCYYCGFLMRKFLESIKKN